MKANMTMNIPNPENLLNIIKEIKPILQRYDVTVDEAMTDYGEGFLWYFKR